MRDGGSRNVGGPLDRIRSVPWALPVFGLTGSIASGKSELLRCLHDLGAHVLDADRLGHDLLREDEECKTRVVRRFGRQVLDEAGIIRRPVLAGLVFHDPAARSDLEAILHPAIVDAARRGVGSMAQERFDVVVLEAALLFESGLSRQMLDSVAVVATEQVQLLRLVQCRGMDEDEARGRIRAQWEHERKASQARWVIRNDGSLEELGVQARLVLDEMRSDPRVLAARDRFG